MKKPKQLDVFMYFLIKDAQRISFVDWLEDRSITEEEYQEIELWFEETANIKL